MGGIFEGVGRGISQASQNEWNGQMQRGHEAWQGEQNAYQREMVRWLMESQQGWQSGENQQNRIFQQMLQQTLQGNMFEQQKNMKLLDAQLRGYMTPGAVAGLNAASQTSGPSTSDAATGPGLIPLSSNHNGLGYGPERAQARMWTSAGSQATTSVRNMGVQAGTGQNIVSRGTQAGATAASTQTAFPKATRAKATNTPFPGMPVFRTLGQQTGSDNKSVGTQASTWAFNEGTQTSRPVSMSTQTGLDNPGRAITGGTQSSLRWTGGPLPGLNKNLLDYSGSTMGTNMVNSAPQKPASHTSSGTGPMTYARVVRGG